MKIYLLFVILACRDQNLAEKRLVDLKYPKVCFHVEFSMIYIYFQKPFTRRGGFGSKVLIYVFIAGLQRKIILTQCCVQSFPVTRTYTKSCQGCLKTQGSRLQEISGIFNRPGVAGAVLQTPPSVTDSLGILCGIVYIKV